MKALNFGPIWALVLLAGPVAGCSSSECDSGEGRCLDGDSLETCVDGQWTTLSCTAEYGQLCQADACVDPWRYGSPEWPTCPDEDRGTSESLVEKVTYYDEIAQRLHVHPQLKWAQGVVLKPGADEATATYQDVERWLSGENDGLWSALYLASQAYRYAATGAPDALSMIRLLMDGQVDRIKVTGVSGMFTRQLIPPNIEGISCPTEDSHYTVDEEKDDNRWVQIRDDGCAWVVDRVSSQWVKTEHCGQEAYAGYCWLDNVSKDEYSGHMFALGAVWKLVDDEQVRAQVQDILRQVGEHIMANDLKIVDWDGRITEHGRFHPLGLDNFPGHNAAMSLSYLSMVIEATQDADLKARYDECLLMRKGAKDCFDTGFVEVLPFHRYLSDPGLYIGNEACRSNYNNISMHTLSMHNLVWFERDPGQKKRYQDSLRNDVMQVPGQPRTALAQNNAFFDFVWAANKDLGPDSDGPAYDAVNNGVCMLKQFRARKTPVVPQVDPSLTAPYCTDRFERDTGEFPREVADRCIRNFVWWGDPYSLSTCGEPERVVEVPTDYLLAYWMGRYYGFIGEAQ